MRVYLSHPFGGKVENRERAEAVQMMYEDVWADEGQDNDLVNPLHELRRLQGRMGEDKILLEAVRLMLTCDAVVFCQGWQKSRGCRLEHLAARRAGLMIDYLDADVEAIAFGTYFQRREAVA